MKYESNIFKGRKKTKVVPGTYDLVFKAVMTSEREYLADIVGGISGIDKNLIEIYTGIKIDEIINN